MIKPVVMAYEMGRGTPRRHSWGFCDSKGIIMHSLFFLEWQKMKFKGAGLFGLTNTKAMQGEEI